MYMYLALVHNLLISLGLTSAEYRYVTLCKLTEQLELPQAPVL